MCNLSSHIPEDDQLKKFWDIEEIKGSNKFLSQYDIVYESLFNENTFRIENGQFVVKFPLKQSPGQGRSKPEAIRRFKTLEKRFADVQFKQLYTDFIQEYETLGHMTKLTIQPDGIKYFLQHHGILKEMSTTTRLRVVFDGNCKTSTGWSLNDLQYIGPKVQNDIINILLRFRTYKFVVSADISKMYRQILIDREHRPLQQILWRDNPKSNFCTYHLNTVTYGTRSAPYLAIKCIKTLAEHNMNQYPKACETILKDMYVDDLLTGSNDLIELQKLCKDIYDVLSSANFILRKWISHNFQVVCGFKDNNISNAILDIGDKESCKTLGIQWDNKNDILKYTIKQFTHRNTITKRHILSIIAEIYDPLGLLSPSIVIAKLIIQKLWSQHIRWDEPIPQDIEQTWYRFQNELGSLNQLSIPRNAIYLNYILTDVHCFCDASRDAYSSCIYLRSVDDSGNYNVQLLCAKTKVSPLKTITIPKLELCTCLLGAQLVNTVVNALNLKNIHYCLWSDSQVALCWINTEPNLLQTFVANRVSKIQSLTNIENWRYVSTKENPADLASRGIMPKMLMSSAIWWKGPQFLLLQSSDWPITNFSISKHDLPELRKSKTILVISQHTKICDLFTKFSCLQRLKRVTAYCMRFINNTRKSDTKVIGPLSVEELENTNTILIKLSQMESFSEELELLRKNKQLDAKHKFASLALFIDEKGIIRVGGRLKNTYLPFNIKHPILLSSKHNFTKLIFNHKHSQLLHPGPQLLLGIPKIIYSDNGTTFHGTNNLLKDLSKFLFNNQASVVNSTSQYNIQWKFMPPYTPNHGGLWEAAV
ncbi:uncharacterized protein LOC130451050 [Diorhabda sublineata]|uniref:uncharacterized protein LOC130451050 n=1 Tax=Diorhabda sublineata TaxID=1163346 RepID=UPI0024E14C38|nr:uncharacterized protein LOC130451050 [Diorhabda sublineata]